MRCCPVGHKKSKLCEPLVWFCNCAISLLAYFLDSVKLSDMLNWRDNKREKEKGSREMLKNGKWGMKRWERQKAREERESWTEKKAERGVDSFQNKLENQSDLLLSLRPLIWKIKVEKETVVSERNVWLGWGFQILTRLPLWYILESL